MTTLVWFRGKDLRVTDHLPLRDAARTGAVIPVFVADPYFFSPEGAKQRPYRLLFLLESIASLADELARRGSTLVVIRGRSVEVIPRLARAWKVDRVVAHRWSEPFARERDRRVREAMEVPFDLYEGETLHPPGTIRTLKGDPYAVFSQFKKTFEKVADITAPLTAPRSLPPVPDDITPVSEPLPSPAEFGLAESPVLATGGERAAHKRLARFLERHAALYERNRNRLDLDATSRLSADLKFGTLSVRTVWTRVLETVGPGPAWEAFHNELVWREFTHSTLWDMPRLLHTPFRQAFTGFPYAEDDDLWQAWVQGMTGYPLVDAAARQLLGEGYVHGRARMIAASFLCKHLCMDYRKGESHYARFLCDGDWAQNNFNWQWSAGCGMDAQPYFRVFNPMTQGPKFDPSGEYVRRWVPELSNLPTRYIHAPWEAPSSELDRAGVRLGKTYPPPIVEHREARERFLAVAREHLKRSREQT